MFGNLKEDVGFILMFVSVKVREIYHETDAL